MTSSNPVPSSGHPLSRQPRLRALLDRLHAISLAQERELNARHIHFPDPAHANVSFEEQLVALDEDKARGMYLILRAMGARRVVEAGTSYGVSLLWILAAVLENERRSSSSSSLPALVIGTENEPTKAAHALAHVEEAFSSIPPALSLLQGDLLTTLPAAELADRSIDALLLDIWAPLALSVLKIIAPKLRIGGIVLVDNTNTTTSAERYRDLLTFLRDERNGFVSSTLPYSGGFELAVFVGTE